MTNVWLWSTTAASNSTADSTLWEEGQLGPTVNNSARDNMAAVAMYRKDTSGETATTGSANAYVLTLATTGLAALADGQKFAFRANHTSTGAATLNVNSLGAKAIVKNAGTALAGSEILSGGIYTVTYVLASDHFRLHAVNSAQVVATATNNSASAGYLGEYASGTAETGAAVPLTTATAANVTSVSLTAGDWDVSGVVAFNFEAATTVHIMVASISQTSATLDLAAGAYGENLLFNNVPGAAVSPAVPTPVVRISLSATTTVYLVTYLTFAVATATGWGKIRARRVR